MATDPMGPQVTDVHVNRPLTNMSVAYMNAPDMYVARQIAPPVSVLKKSDVYFTYDQGDFLRDDLAQRAPGGVYPESGYGLNASASYTCIEYALAKRVADEERSNSDVPLRPDQDAVDFLTEKAKIHLELAVATDLTNTGNFTNYLDVSASSNQWDDFANSNPIAEVWVGRRTIRTAVQRRANILLLAAEVIEDAFMDHPDILDRIKHTERGNEMSIRNALAGIFGVEKVVEGAAAYNSAAPGASDTIADIWGDHALLAYVSPRPALKTPSMAYTFEWLGGPKVTTKRDELRDSDVHRIRYVYDHKLVAEKCGYLFDNAT